MTIHITTWRDFLQSKDPRDPRWFIYDQDTLMEKRCFKCSDVTGIAVWQGFCPSCERKMSVGVDPEFFGQHSLFEAAEMMDAARADMQENCSEVGERVFRIPGLTVEIIYWDEGNEQCRIIRVRSPNKSTEDIREFWMRLREIYRTNHRTVTHEELLGRVRRTENPPEGLEQLLQGVTPENIQPEWGSETE